MQQGFQSGGGRVPSRGIHDDGEAQAIAQRGHWQTWETGDDQTFVSTTPTQTLLMSFSTRQHWVSLRSRTSDLNVFGLSNRHQPLATELEEHAPPKNWKNSVPRNSAATQAGGTLPNSPSIFARSLAPK